MKERRQSLILIPLRMKKVIRHQIEKLEKIAKSMPCSKIRENYVNTPKSARNYLTLEEKLEIIKLRENDVSSTKIGSDKNIAESSDYYIR